MAGQDLKLVRVTMRGKGWEDFTGVACGIEFEDGEALLAMSMDKTGRDMLCLNNVCSTYVGTSYVVEGDYVPGDDEGDGDGDDEGEGVPEEDQDDGDAPDEDGDGDDEASNEAVETPEGSPEIEGEGDASEGQVDEDASAASTEAQA